MILLNVQKIHFFEPGKIGDSKRDDDSFIGIVLN